MAYNYSKGAQVIGDLKAADDAQRDTKIDFEEDYIALHTSGSAILIVSGSKVAIGPQPDGVSSFPSYKLDVNGDIRIRNNNIRDNSGDKAISFDGQANTTISGSLTISGSVRNYTFPTTDGNANQVLQTNGSGVLTFVDVDDGEGGGGGEGGGPQTPEVMKVGLASNFQLNPPDAQVLQLSSLSFDTFSGSAGWDSGQYRFVAAEEGYYDISATIVFDNMHENATQYQVWLMSNSDEATPGIAAISGSFIAAGVFSGTPSDTDMATVHVSTIAHLSASQSASIKVRQTGASQTPVSQVFAGKNRTFMCVKKL